MVPEIRVFQAADGEELEMLAWTVFAWSTHVTDGRADGRTELRYLRHAESIAAFAHNDATWTLISQLVNFQSTVSS